MGEKTEDMRRSFSWSSFDKRVFDLLDKACVIAPFLVIFITFIFDNLSVRNGVLTIVLVSPLLLFQFLFWRNGAYQIIFDFNANRASFFMLRNQNIVNTKISDIKLVKRLGDFFTFFVEKKKIRYKCKNKIQTKELARILNGTGKLKH